MAGLQDVKMWCLSTSGYWVLGDEGIAELQRGSQKSRSGGGRRGGRGWAAWGVSRSRCCCQLLLPTSTNY